MVDVLRCVSLCREGLRNEELAKKVDRIGNTPDAAEKYQKAAETLNHAAAHLPLGRASEAAQDLSKQAKHFSESICSDSAGKAATLYKIAIKQFYEAALCCPPALPDKAMLETHVLQLEVRVMYLESLNGAPTTVPIEDHVQGMTLTLGSEGTASSTAADSADLAPASGGYTSSAPVPAAMPPSSASVPSGMPPLPPPSEPPPSSSADVATSVLPAPSELPGPKPVTGSSSISETMMSSTEAESCAAASRSPASFSTALAGPSTAPPAKPRGSAEVDWLKTAVEKEREAKDLDGRGMAKDALATYTDCISLYAFVLKRENNGNVKQTIRTRMAQLLDRAEVLKAQVLLGL